MHIHYGVLPKREYAMSRLVRFLFALGMLVATLPASAQGTPTAPPELTTGEQVVSMVERIGGVSNAIQLCIVFFVLIVAYRGLKPLLEALKDEREARKEERQERLEAQRELAALRERQAAADDRRLVVQERQAELDERMVARLKDLETSEEAKQRSINTVTEINQHTTEIFTEAKEQLVSAASKIDEAAASVKDVVTKEHLNSKLEPILAQLETISLELRRRAGDTGPLDASKVPDTDPATPPALTEPPAEHNTPNGKE